MLKIGLIAMVAILYATSLGNEAPVIMEAVPRGALKSEEAVEVDATELECLAMNTYHEARGEDKAGRQAVIDVVLNRVRSRRFPNTVCEVVWQKKCGLKNAAYNGCTAQFTWTWDGRPDTVNNVKVYKRLVELATRALQRSKPILLPKAVLYHTDAVLPRWSKSKKLRKVKQIGEHVFYAYNN